MLSYKIFDVKTFTPKYCYFYISLRIPIFMHNFIEPQYDFFGMVAFPWSLRNRQKIKWTYLRLHTTHAHDFWYGKRYWQYLFLCQKSSTWVVCRRRYGHFIFLRPGSFYNDRIFNKWRNCQKILETPKN